MYICNKLTVLIQHKQKYTHILLVYFVVKCSMWAKFRTHECACLPSYDNSDEIERLKQILSTRNKTIDNIRKRRLLKRTIKICTANICNDIDRT